MDKNTLELIRQAEQSIRAARTALLAAADSEVPDRFRTDLWSHAASLGIMEDATYGLGCTLGSVNA